MRKRYSRLIFLVSVLLGVDQAQGQTVIVEYFNIGGAMVGSDTYAPNQSFDVLIDNVIFSVRVRTSSSSVDIGSMTIDSMACCDGGQPVWIYVTPEMVPGSGFPSSASGRDWRGASDFRNAGTTNVKGRIGRNLIQDINIKTLQSFQAEGEIRARVTSDQGPFFVRAQSVTSAGDMRSDFANITLVHVTAGNLRGDVRAPNGNVQGILVDNGDVGQPGSPILIEASGLIRSIVAGNIYANIDADISDPNPTGTINTLDASGDLDGTVSMADFTNFLVGQDLLGTVTLGNALTGELEIGRSLGAMALIDIVPEAGLLGRITMNTTNTGGVWNGTAQVGSISLTVPHYTETAEELGGGSAGLAPFALHDESCDPPNSVPRLLIPSPPAVTVKLRHYGRVMLAGSAPLTFDRRLACTADPFVSLPATDFDVAPDLFDNNSVIVSGAPGKPGFEIGYEYRIQPDLVTMDLQCDQVVGNPPVAWDGPYHMIVQSTCEADIDGDGMVNVLDLVALLICFGQPSSPNCVEEDINCDGVVNVLDLIALLLVFGQPCVEGESAQGGGSGDSETDGLQLALEQLGWNSWQEWVNDLRQLDPGEQTACVLQVLGLVCDHD